MNWFQRVVLAFAFRIAPGVERFIAEARANIDSLLSENHRLRSNAAPLFIEGAALMEAARAFGMREGYTLATPAGAIAVRETITSLQLDMEDQGYRLLVARSQTEFTRPGLDLIIMACRLFFLKNPLVLRGVSVSSFYVFGRGVEVSSPDEKAKEALAAFFDDCRNRAELSQSALIQAHNTLQTDGNLFYVLFPNKDDGTVVIRSVDVMEIREVITDPDDASCTWYFKRAWTQANFDLAMGNINPESAFAWYPALGYDPPVKPAMIGGQPVMWDTPMHQMKAGCLKKWRFGCPTAYPALDWTQAYTKLLTDYCQKNANLARFGLKATTKGGAAGVAAIKGRLNSTYATAPDYSERNPAPQTGSTFVSGEGVNLEALMTRGANTDPEEGRRVMLMVCNVFHLAEHMFGDASVGTRATTDSLERPTQLAFETQQNFWKEDFFEPIGRYVLGIAKPAPNSRSELRAAGTDTEKVEITTSFPPIIELDIDKAVAAAQLAVTLDGKSLAGTADPRTAVLTVMSPIIGQDRAQTLAEDMYPDPYDPSDYGAPNPADAPEPIDPLAAGGGSGSPQPGRSSRRPPVSPKPK